MIQPEDVCLLYFYLLTVMYFLVYGINNVYYSFILVLQDIRAQSKGSQMDFIWLSVYQYHVGEVHNQLFMK